jgi:enediyne biosynthesis protein E4
LAVGDFDNDGALDFMVNNNGGNGHLFHNNGTAQNHWLEIRLIGTRSNREGVGALVKLMAATFASYDQAKGGLSYCSAQDLLLHFGLGSHANIDSIDIQLPSGTHQVLRKVAADKIITVEETRGIIPSHFSRVAAKQPAGSAQAR